ncbi:predicted protein [Postia placenta Mad-698-R]|uniref:Mid2 domain-containing protein n=1 Tax=Postia placenta MAD-698-R-SB12 TaxID=670580 RepID=A0A1X6MLA1_9APHY|nr:hypothetical protein POSPLADRAFT_1157832 [Postia placenta MAD-698-R-SB12]EED81965.1 predicted protein [Postia placenta Mad-698-R]OSX57135.1 hypothetical protein POSPLADRAFT_1157832 [Postia placenta MAD-698-R-SB12]
MALRYWVIGLVGASLVQASNTTTCASGALDWYIDAVGETPCMTYQRLRQICNSYSTCCCNSIAWSLSMLCMNCQQNIKGNDSGDVDAPAGAYFQYRNISKFGYCGAGTNQSSVSLYPFTFAGLPAQVQSAVCNTGIRLDNFLYDFFWDNGACTYTREQSELDQAQSDNNTFTHCPNATTTSASSQTAATGTGTGSSQTRTTAAPSGSVAGTTSSSKSVDTGAIVGGAVGGAAGLIVLALVAFFAWYRRLRTPGQAGMPSPVTQGMVYSGGSGPETVSAALLIANAAPPDNAASPSLTPKRRPVATMPNPSSYSPSSDYVAVPNTSNVAGSSNSSDVPNSHIASPSDLVSASQRDYDAGPIAVAKPSSPRPPPAYRSSWGSD